MASVQGLVQRQPADAPPRFLIVDDEETDCLVCARLLRRAFGDSVTVEWVTRWEDAKSAIETGQYDVHLVDHYLGDHTGTTLIQKYKERMQGRVFFLLTGDDNKETEMAAVDAGASDFLLKSDLTLDRLERSIRFALSETAQKQALMDLSAKLELARSKAQEESKKHLALAEELKETQQELQVALKRAEQSEEQYRYLAQHDTLTGLPNRMLFADRIQTALSSARRQKGNVALLLCDLDKFKQINDMFGHLAGDHLLSFVALRLSKCFRNSDTVARLGGDEFAVLLTWVEPGAQSSTVAQTIVCALASPVPWETAVLRSGTSVGIALATDPADGAEDLLHQADLAMYNAKDAGGTQYQFFDTSLNAAAKRETKMRQALPEALFRNELSLLFQPKVHLKTGTISGVEALTRWNNGDVGDVQASEFIALAEATGQIVPISEWVFDNALSVFTRLRETVGISIPFSVNVSAVQLKKGELPEQIENLLKRHNVPPEMLDLEITETSAVENLTWAADQLETIRGMGVQISIDDFGAGYSSLAMATKLPADHIKIDQSFVAGMIENQSDAAAVRSAVSLAHAMGMEVVAEGIESEQQIDFLRDIDCTFGQGFFLGKPMSEADLHHHCRDRVG